MSWVTMYDGAERIPRCDGCQNLSLRERGSVLRFNHHVCPDVRLKQSLIYAVTTGGDFR